MRKSRDDVKENNRSYWHRTSERARRRNKRARWLDTSAEVFQITVTDLKLRLACGTGRIGLSYNRRTDLIAAGADQKTQWERELKEAKARHEVILVDY